MYNNVEQSGEGMIILAWTVQELATKLPSAKGMK